MSSKFKATFTPQRTEVDAPSYGTFEKPTEELLGSLYGYPTKDAGLLPPVVRSFDPSMRAFLVERTPFYANISFKNCRAGSNSAPHIVYSIPVPWTVYLVRLNDLYCPEELYVWARPGQIHSEDDPLFYLPLPNTYENGGTCLGRASFGGVGSGGYDSISHALSLAVNTYWTTSSNTDLDYWMSDDHSRAFSQVSGDRIPPYNGPAFLKSWSKMRSDDVMKVKMRRSSTRTVADALHLMRVANNVPVDAASLQNLLMSRVMR